MFPGHFFILDTLFHGQFHLSAKRCYIKIKHVNSVNQVIIPLGDGGVLHTR